MDETLKLNVMLSAVNDIQKGSSSSAENKLLELIRVCQSEDHAGKNLKFIIFASALAKRFSQACFQEANLYLKEYELPQIELFNLMAKKFPLIQESGKIANSILAEYIREKQAVTLVNIGIGSGRQEAMLLAELAASKSLPQSLTIVGIEPASHCLAEAEKLLSGISSSFGVAFQFHSFSKCIEDFSDLDWIKLKSLGSNVIVNEAFSIHHVKDKKDDVLKKIANHLCPAVFVLTEPHSDHHSSDLKQRFENSWKHFGLTFDLIDQTDLTLIEKGSLKAHFFAREIEDILGNEESQRVERHETAFMWIERLKRAGFRVLSQNKASYPLKSPGITLSRHEEFVSLDVHQEAVVSVMVAAIGP